VGAGTAALLVASIFTFFPLNGLSFGQDFEACYRAVLRLTEGANPYAGGGRFPFVYSYALLLPVGWLADLSLGDARLVAYLASAGLFLVAVAGLARAAQLDSDRKVMGVLALVLVFGHQMSVSTLMTTLNVEVFCLAALAWAFAFHAQPTRFYGCVCLAALIKPHYAIFLIPQTLLSKRYREAGAALAVLVLAYGIPFLVHPEYLSSLLDNLSQRSVEIGYINPAPVALAGLPLPGAARLVAALAILGVGTAILLRTMRGPWAELSDEQRMMATLVFFALCTPRLKDYSLMLFLLPVLISLRRHHDHVTTLEPRWLLVAIPIVWALWDLSALVYPVDALMSLLAYANLALCLVLAVYVGRLSVAARQRASQP